MKLILNYSLLLLILFSSKLSKADNTNNACLEEYNVTTVTPLVDFTPGSLFAGFARRSVWLRASMNEAGTIYFVLYDADPGVLNANDIRNDVMSGVGGSRVGVSQETFSAADVPDNPSFPGTPYTGARFTGLAQGVTYYYAIVAFDVGGTNSGTVIQGNDVTAFQPCVVGTPDSGQQGSDTNLCGPRMVGFRVSFTGIQYEDPYLLQYGYEFEVGNALDRVTPTLLNPSELNILDQEWEGSNFYTYPDNGTQCTYDALAFLIYNTESTCTNIFQEQTYAVYDDIANNALGQIDVSDPLDGDDTIEVCEGEEVVVNFNNTSTINCVDPIELDIPNTRQRWVQYVYGFNSADADFMDDVEVDATAAGDGIVTTFPYAGPIEFLNTPVDETTPLPPTFDIRVLPTNVFGVDDRFVVRLRMWNICNPYDEVLDNPFGTGGLSPESGDFVDGDENPIFDDAEILLVQQPPIPTAVPKEICHEAALPTFEILIPPGPVDFVNWYDNDPNTTGVLITQTAGNTLNAITGGVPNNTTSGVYTVWAEYQRQTTGVGTRCVSEAIPTTITIREDLTNPGAITSASSFPVCAEGSPNIVFSVPDPPGTGVPGGPWEYDWSFATGTFDDNLTFVGATNGQSVTVNINNASASGTRRIRVRRVYQNGDLCPSGRTTFDFDIDPAADGGTTSGAATFCSGGDAIITLNSGTFTGNSITWQRATGAGPFVNLTGPTFDDQTNITDPGLTSGATTPQTYRYRAQVMSGVCPTAAPSTETLITVNPVPSIPNISGVTDICADATTTLTASSNAAAGSFQWFRNGVAVAGETASTITLGNGDSGDYTVEAYFGVGSTDCPSGQSPITTVTVEPLPTAINPIGGGSVCAGNAAPDIVWTLTGRPPFDINYTVTLNGGTVFPVNVPSYTPPEAVAPYTFTISAPNPPVDFAQAPVAGDNYVYQFVSLSDDVVANAPSCTQTAFVGTATVSVGGTPPTFDTPPSLDIAAVCDDGPLTLDPELLFSLDDAGSASQSGFILTYNVDGSADRQINFNTDATGSPTVPIVLSDAELNLTVPAPHVIEIVSIISPTGCLSIFNTPLNFTVNPRPADATGANDLRVCTPDILTATLSVDDPALLDPNLVVDWYGVPTGGAPLAGGIATVNFVPGAVGTYHAEIRNSVTGCPSNNRVPLVLSEDPEPSVPTAQGDDQTCDDFYTLNANPVSPAGATGFWSTSGTLYYENFDNLADGLVNDPGVFGWTTDVSALVSFSPPGDYFEVRSGRFEGLDLGNGSTNAIWRSEVIDVSTVNSVDISALLYKNGDLETGDFVEIYHILDGVPTKFGELVRAINDVVPPDPALIELPVLESGLNVSAVNNLQIEVRMRSNGGDDIQGFDDIIVRESASSLTFDDIFLENATVSGLQDGANSVFWNVVSEFGVCPIQSEEVIITKIPAPTGVDLTDEFCEDTFNGTTTAGVDLSTYDNLVIGAAIPADRTVQWFSDDTRTIAAGPVVTVSNGDIFYALITETVSGDNCTNDFMLPGSITFTVNTLPEGVDQDASNNIPETEFCEDIVGGGTRDDINLTALNDDVIGGAAPADRDITWFEDPLVPVTLPSDLVTTVVNENDVDGVQDGDIFYALIENNITGCQNIAAVTITVNPRPGNNNIVGNNFQCVDATSLQIYQITPGPVGTTYVWNIPGLFTQFGGGTINDPFVILQFPTAGTGVIEVTEISPDDCPGELEDITVTVENAPSGLSIAGPDEVCEGEAGVVFSTASLPNTTYAWTVPVGSSIISGQGSASITVNFGATGGNVEVVPTSTTGNCSGTVPPKPVTINQRPVLDPGLNKSVCSDQNIELTLAVDGSSPVAATTYNVTASVAPGLSANSGPTTGVGLVSTDLFNDNYNNTTGGPLNVTYVVTPVSIDNCEGAPVNVVIRVDPEPVMASTLNVTECSDVPINLLLNTAPGSVIATTYNVISVNIPGTITASAGNAIFPQSGVLDTYLQNDEYTNTTGIAVIVEYVVSPVSADGCEGDPLTINATINPEPVIDPALTADVCSDDVIGLTLATNGISVGANTYNILGVTIPGALTANAGNAAFPITGVASNYLQNDIYSNNNSTIPLDVIYEVAGVSAVGCIGESQLITVTIRPEPVVTPGISNTVCSDDASLLVLSSEVSSVAANDYNITGVIVPPGLTANAGNAVVPASNVADNYLAGDIYNNVTNAPIDVTYTVRGVSADGCVGDDEIVTLTVNPEPVLDPNLGATLCSGESTGVTLITNGTSETAISFDVISITPDAGLTAAGGNVPAANGVAANYILNDAFSNTTNGQLNVVYQVVPNGTNGCVGDIETITLSYNPEPVISPALDATVCSDQVIGVTLSTNGVSIGAATYNVIDVVIPAGVTADAANAAFPFSGVIANYITTDSYANQTAGDLIVEYEVRGVSGDGCEGQSEFIQVTIQPEPVIDPNLDLIECSDTPIGLILNTNGVSIAAANYNIIGVTIDGGLTPAAGNAVFPANAVADNYLSLDEYTNTTTGPLDVIYEVRGVSGVNCPGDSETITVTINPEPIVNTSLDATVCSDEVSGINLLTEALSVGAVSYNLVNVVVPGGLIPAGTNVVPANNVSFDYISNDAFNNPTNGSLDVEYEVQAVSVDNCIGDSEFILLTVDPEPVVDPNLDKPVCSDVPIALFFDTDPTSVAAVSYNVVAISVPPALTPGVANVVPANGIGANYVSNDVFTNITNAPLDVIYQVQGVSAAGCVGDADLISITINPEPVIATNLDGTVCSDDIIGVTLNTNGVSIAADTYNIVDVTIPAGLTPDAGNAVFPTMGLADNAIVNDLYNNITNTSLDVIYEIQGVSNGCTGESEFITVTIDPEPVITPNLDLTECSDVPIGLLLTTTASSANAASYDILSINVDPDLTPAGSNVAAANGVADNYLINDSYTNVTNAPHIVIYEVRATSADVCLSDIETITVTINPEPVVQVPVPQIMACSDVAIGLVLNTDGVSIGASSYNILSLFIPAGLIPDGGNSIIPANGVAATAISANRFTNTTSGSLDVIYEVQGISADGCLGDIVNIPVTIDAGPVIDPNLDATVCSDVAVGIIFDIFAGSVAATSYNLVSITPNPSLIPGVGNVPPANNQADNYIANDTWTNTSSIPLNVTYEVRGVSALGCVGTSEFIVVTIDPEPIIDPNLDKTVCSDVAVGLLLATEGSSVGANNYNIIDINIAPGIVASPGNVPLANGVVAGYLSGDVYTNTTGGPLDVVYEVVGVSAAPALCSGDSRFITVTIDPEPEVDPNLDATVCSDEPTGVTLGTAGTSVAAASYNIINKTVPGGITQAPSNATVPANGVADNYILNDSYTNLTSGSINIIYEVRPVSAQGCLGNSELVVITVNPEPVIDPNLFATVCSDDPIGITLNTNGISVGADTYDLVSVVPAAGLTAGGANVVPANGLADNAIQNDAYTNTTFTPLQVVYTVRGRSAVLDGDCLGDGQTITVTIDPEPVVNPALDASVCSGDISDIVLSTNGTSVAASSYELTAPVNIISGVATPQPGNAAPGIANQNFIRNDRFENVGTVDAIVEYRIVPISPSGCRGEEEIILLTVQPEPVLDVIPSFNPAPVCSDLPSNITLSNTATSAVATTFNITGIAVQSGLIPGASNASIQDGLSANAIFNDSYTNTTNSPLTVTYTIVPVSAAGCEGDAGTVVFTINPAPEVADLNTITCSDETSEIQLAIAPGSAIAADYDIMDIRPAAGLVPNAGNSIIGLAGGDIDYIRNDVFTNPTDNPLNVEYDIVAISGPGCRGPLRTIVLTIEPQATVIPVANENICSRGMTAIVLNSNTVPSNGDVTFSYTAVSTGSIFGFSPFGSGFPQGHVIDDVLRNLGDEVDTVIYTITPELLSGKNGLGCTNGTPIQILAIVEPEPKLQFTNSFLLPICEGVSLDELDNFLLTPTVPSNGNVEFVLNGDPVATGGVTGFSPNGTVYAPGDEIVDILDNPTTSNQTVTYTFTPRAVGTDAGTCIGDDVSLTVTVAPRPVVTPDPAALIPSIATPTVELCSSEPRDIELFLDVANTIAEWTVTANDDVDGESESLGRSLFLSLINTSTVPQTLTYTITPFSLFDNSCKGDPITIDVIVNPSPEVTIADPEPTRCDGDQTGILLDGPTPGSTFSWEAQVVSGSVILPNTTGTGTNGDVINDVLTNTGTTPAIIRYTIRASYNKINADDPGDAVCNGLLPGFVTLTLSPPVGGSIVPDPDVGTGTRFRCTGDTEAIQFNLLGAAPFTLILDKTENGVTTQETLTGLPSQHIILATETVSYSIVEVIDNNNCNATPTDNVDVVFEDAIADFTINGSKNPAPVTLDFNTGTVTVDIVINNYNSANTYQLTIGPDVVPVTGPNLTYTFSSPSPFGTIGFLAELNVQTPNVSTCNDNESFFIQVVPAEPTVIGVADVVEGCAPLTVNFESFRDDLSLSRNVVLEELKWDFDDGTPIVTNPNPSHTFNNPGSYNVIVRGSNGYPGSANEASASIIITVFDNPDANFRSNQDVIFIPDQAFRPINNSSTFVTDWFWDWGDGNITSGQEEAASPEHIYELEGEYLVELTASVDYGNGIVCSDSDTLTVKVEEGGFSRTPNAFTPSLDGPRGGAFDPRNPGTAGDINDVFLPITEGVEEFQMIIFDRWGNLIFETNDKNFGWDGYDSKGNLMPAGVYVYRLDLLLSDGNRTTRVGDVTLIR